MIWLEGGDTGIGEAIFKVDASTSTVAGITPRSFGFVEKGETYIGDKIKNMHARKPLSLNQGRSARKVTVMGMLDRKSATLS